jgi:transcriptional antiterminator
LFSLENFCPKKNFMSTRTIYRKITGLSGCLDNYHLSLNLRKKNIQYPGMSISSVTSIIFFIGNYTDPAKTYDCLTDSQVSELDHLLTEHYPYYRNIGPQQMASLF